MSQMVEQILAVNRHLRAAIDQVSDGVLIIDADLKREAGPEVVFVNQGFCQLCGRTREELVGRSLVDIFPSNHLSALTSFLQGVEAAGTGSANFPAPLETSLCGGDTIVLNGSASATLGSGGQALNFTLTVAPVAESDVKSESQPPVAPQQIVPVAVSTEVASSELCADDESRKPAGANEIMDASRMESLALVAGGIAHDFNNVLTTILANLSLAMPLVRDEKDLGAYLKHAASASESAKGLTKKLLSFARGGKPKKEPSHLGALLEEAVELSTYGSNVRCEVRIDPNLHQSDVDGIQMIQIFNNLLINAWQAMPSGGVIQATAEYLYLQPGEDADLPAGHYTMISVRDRGCGIPEEKLGQIFEPFYTTKRHGSGLGLATCATVIREHGGVIRVKSKIGAGTVFRVYLPASEEMATRVTVPAPVADRDKEVVRGQGGSVLVVDDQQAVLDVACLILTKLGYDVHGAVSGQDGVERFRYLSQSESRVEAVLMDMTLPGGMNGREATAEIMRIDPGARVVATSGFFDDEARDTLQMSGFVGVLPKPFTIESLSQVMHDAVNPEELGSDTVQFA